MPEYVKWKDAKVPELKSDERLMRVHVVRSRPLADSALARALEYRARVVDLLQKRIEVIAFRNLLFSSPFWHILLYCQPHWQVTARIFTEGPA